MNKQTTDLCRLVVCKSRSTNQLRNGVGLLISKIRKTRALQPVATWRQSPYLH